MIEQDLLGWVTYQKSPKQKVQECIAERNQKRARHEYGFPGKQGGVQTWEQWELGYSNDERICNPTRPQAVSLTEKPTRLRQTSTGDTLLPYLTVTAILVLLIVLSKDVKITKNGKK